MFFCILLFLLSSVCVLGYDGSSTEELTKCPRAFKGLCHCGKGHYPRWKPDVEQYIVNCTNTGFVSTEMLELLPNETQVIIFTGNKLIELDWNIFGVWDDHKFLEVVDLSNNRIENVPGKTFHKVSNVKQLILNHNNLKISGSNSHPRVFSNFYNLEELFLTNAFTETIDSGYYLGDLKDIFLASNMTKLKKLSLEQNEIWKMESEDMFCDLPNLSELLLSDNQLQKIEFSLNCLKQLRYLDLQYNKIKRLDNATLHKLEKAFGGSHNSQKVLKLNENPFVCDCHLRNFFDWMLTPAASFLRKEELRCYDGWPISNAGKRIITISRLQCPPRPSNSSERIGVGTSITHALLIILIFIVGGLLGSLLYINRSKIKSNVSPLIDSFQKSMQYKTIEKDENPPVAHV